MLDEGRGTPEKRGLDNHFLIGFLRQEVEHFVTSSAMYGARKVS